VAFAIRPAVLHEVEALLVTYEWLFAEPGLRPPNWDHTSARSALREAIVTDESTVAVADADGSVIGMCSAYLDLNSVRFGLRCWVADLAVDPRERSTGVGRALLDHAKDWGRERGATHLELSTGLDRRDAQRFYEREQPDATGYCYSWAL
jgi:GNAT superfamily N-acetyltransferase